MISPSFIGRRTGRHHRSMAENGAIEVGKGGRGLVEGSVMWEEDSHCPNYVEFSIKSTYENVGIAFSTIPTS